MLTQRQQLMVQRYLREAAAVFDAQELPERARARAMNALQARVEASLEPLKGNAPTDEAVAVALERLGAPGEQARHAVQRTLTLPKGLAIDLKNRVWLGVCAGIAHSMDFQPWIIRAVALVLGCMLGPFALLAYLAVFAGLCVHPGHPDLPPIRYGRAAWRLAGSLAGAILLYETGRGSLWAIHVAQEQFLKRNVPVLKGWDWLEYWQFSLCFWAFLSSGALAVLSAMPLPPAWAHSLKRAAQAAIALYGIVLAFGIASYLTGMILDVVSEFSGAH